TDLLARLIKMRFDMPFEADDTISWTLGFNGNIHYFLWSFDDDKITVSGKKITDNHNGNFCTISSGVRGPFRCVVIEFNDTDDDAE
ncbi:hypothetical protein PENTCL1PPCAC_12686, partial [Pristionchus entomophagus]